MKNNKGYMLVEIIIASVITMTIAYLLLDLTYSFKTNNDDTFYETIFLTEKTLMTKEVMNDINNNNVRGVDFSCNNTADACFEITFQNGEDSIVKRLTINNNVYEYGTYKNNAYDSSDYYKKTINDKLNISSPNIVNHCYEETGDTVNGIITCKEESSNTYALNGMLEITLPLSSNYLKEDLGVKISIPYSTLSVDNSPPSILATGMIPVKYNGTTLVKADETNNDNSWYNYDSKMWANAVLVTSGTRDTYMNASVGTAITESDVLAYYVWIPRYKYKLWNTTFTTSSPQEIDIVFENITDPISNGTTNGQYLSHPAFWWDNNSNGIRETGEELAGIWVGKFETSTDVACTATNYSVGTACDLTTLNPRILPNVISWRGARVSTFFSGIKKIESTTYINNPTEIDSHMMKNMEWGAVAYLSYSKYGKNAELEINDNSSYLTGDGAYKTNILQSTTGNITGVYDMSGGAYEYMMGVQQDNAGTNTPMSGKSTTYNSGFTGKAYDGSTWTNITGTTFPAKKYYDLYAYGTTYNDQTAYNRSHLGDATGETRAWYSDYAIFVCANYPWFVRGGSYFYGSSAGAFAFFHISGDAYSDRGVRGVLLANVSEPLNN